MFAGGVNFIVSPLHGYILYIHLPYFFTPLLMIDKKGENDLRVLYACFSFLCIYFFLISCFWYHVLVYWYPASDCIDILFIWYLASNYNEYILYHLASRAYIAYSFGIKSLSWIYIFCIHLVPRANIAYLYNYYDWYHALSLNIYIFHTMHELRGSFYEAYL